MNNHVVGVGAERTAIDGGENILCQSRGFDVVAVERRVVAVVCSRTEDVGARTVESGGVGYIGFVILFRAREKCAGRNGHH